MRRLPGSAVSRLSEGVQTPEALSNCFGTGREHKLNLLCGLSGALDSKWMSGSAVQEPQAERQRLRKEGSDQTKSALSQARLSNLVLSS
jgi:hypothetical protein